MGDSPWILRNGKIITPASVIENGWLRWRGAHIVEVGAAPAPDAPSLDMGGRWVLPGFFDLHVHGGDGVDTMHATPDALGRMARFYARHGVTSFLATTWTDTTERITAALENAAACQGPIENGATLRGVHLEGPYINPAKGGAQNDEHIRRADAAEWRPWLDMDVIRLVSLAPEYPENQAFAEACIERGITVSAAHTAATYEQLCAAIAQGVSHITHTYNAMTGLHHREPGALGAALTEPGVCCEVIADGIHVHPAALKLLWAAKGADGMILITDAMLAAGLPDGTYPLDSREVVLRDGAARLPDGTLAGSTLTMDHALRNFMTATGAALVEVWRCTSLNPARAAGLDDQTGSIEPGKDADFVVLDADLRVWMTVARGEVVFSSEL